jgi:hydrophobic/amphiphilic exporter-1 (mainly G- bacteria), HAE1 family
MNRPNILLLALALSGRAQAESLSRAEAVARALQANPDVQKSLEDRRRLNGIILEARADALPELTLLGSWNRYRDPGLLNSSSFDAFPPDLRDSLTPVPANLYEGLATLKQTLFSFKLGHAIKAAKLGRGFGEEEIRRVQQAVALRAVRAYDGYLLAIEKVKVGAKAVVQKEKHLEQAQNRYASGVATELDVLRSKVDLENQRTALLRFQGEAELARGTLNAVMLRPIETPLEPTDHLEYRPVVVDLAQAVRVAWQNRPEAKAIDLQEKIQRELVGVAKSEGRPSLELNGAYGWSVREPSNFLESDFSKWSAGIVLKIPLFDGLRTAGKVAQAEAERNKIGQDRLDLENQIRLEAKNAVDVLNVAKSVYQASELNVAQAGKALEMTQANYNYGAATLLDVLDAQAALTLAESNRIEALYAHGIARATLRYTMAQDPLEPAAPDTTEGSSR